MQSQIGASGQFFAEGRDLTPFLRSTRGALSLEAVQDTKLRPAGYWHTYLAGLRGGTDGFSGDVPSDAAETIAELQDAVGSERGPRVIMSCPFGADVGKLSVIGKSLRNSFEMSEDVPGLVLYSGEYQKTAGSPGVLAGLCAFTPNGAGAVDVPTIQNVVLTAAAGAGTITQSGGNTFTITPGDSASTVQTAARATGDANYDAVVVSGSSTPSLVSDLTTGLSLHADDGAFADYQNINDDDEATHGTSPGAGSWVEYDLGSLVAIGKFRVNFKIGAAGSAVELRANAADDAENGTLLATVTNTAGGDTGWAEANSSDAVSTFRYVRITTTDSISIREIEILPPADTAGNGTYTFTFPTGVGNVPAMTTASSGFSAVVAQSGGTSAARNVITAPDNGTALHDVTAATTSGLIAVLQVLEATGSGKTLSARVAHSADGTTFTSLGTFTAATERGAQVLEIAPGVTINAYVRVEVTAVTGSFVIAAGIARRF